MEGAADIARETQNLRVVVVPEINAGTAACVATRINPAIGLGTFLAQMFLSEPLAARGHAGVPHRRPWDRPAGRARQPQARGRGPAAAAAADPPRPTTTR